MDDKQLIAFLLANADKPFVKRILYPDQYPTMDLGNGNIATHQMAWGTPNGKNVVFPTITYDGKNLMKLGPKAFRRAMDSGNYVEFETPEQADWFSKNYKRYWEIKK